jgi:hypothetical protein
MGGDIHVDLGEGKPLYPDEFVLDVDGNAMAAAPDEGEYSDEYQHSENLALKLDEQHLGKLGRDIAELVEGDITERAPWRDRFERGLEMMGLIESDIDDGPFPGASNAVHPLLIEAVTQFWARSMGELFPPEGPAKGKVNGHQTAPMLQRATRVADFMNYDMLRQDRGYMSETSRLLWFTPFHGTAFRKTYRDPVFNRNVGVYVPAEDFIVPAEATDLYTCQRFTHRMRKSQNEMRRLQHSKYYRKVNLAAPTSEDHDEISQANQDIQDVAPDSDEVSNRYEVFEVCIDIDLEGDEHIDEAGEPTGIERSYIVSIERHSQIVLAIYRNWDEDDANCERKVYFEKYEYVPGPGFYGLGLFHLIGGLQTAATGALRVLLDSAASASLSGGFVSKNANLQGQRLISTPGQWTQVDASTEDLSKAFFPMPVKDPSPVLLQLMAVLVQAGQRFVATTDVMTGDADPKGAPVGTTSQLIEQGGKVMSTIHRMLHGSLTRELQLRYELCRRFVPADGYPYDVGDGQQRTVYADDFSDGVSVVPVSDPNIFSSQQRLGIAQAIYQMAMESGVIPIKKAARRVLEAMKAPDIDDLIPEDPQPQPYDPIGEIQALLTGKPIAVIPQQNHVAHLQTLWAFMSNPQYGGNEQVQKQVGPNALAIIGQHMAFAWSTHARGLGVQSGYIDPMSGQMQGAAPPEQIAAAVAQFAPQMAAVAGMPVPQEDGKDGKGQDEIAVERAKLQIEREKHQQDMQMALDKHKFEIQKLQAKLQADQQAAEMKMQIESAKAQGQMQMAQEKTQLQRQQMQQDAAMQQEQHQHQMGLERQNAEQSLQQEQMMGQQKMHMQSQEMQQQQQLGQQKMHQEGQAHQQKMHQQTAQPPHDQSQPGGKLGHLR